MIPPFVQSSAKKTDALHSVEVLSVSGELRLRPHFLLQHEIKAGVLVGDCHDLSPRHCFFVAALADVARHIFRHAPSSIGSNVEVLG